MLEFIKMYIMPPEYEVNTYAARVNEELTLETPAF